MKCLLLDKDTKAVVSMVYSMNEILSKEVYRAWRRARARAHPRDSLTPSPEIRAVVESLESTHESLGHMKAIILARPTNDSIKLIAAQLREPKFLEYHIFFTNIVPQVRPARTRRAASIRSRSRADTRAPPAGAAAQARRRRPPVRRAAGAGVLRRLPRRERRPLLALARRLALALAAQGRLRARRRGEPEAVQRGPALGAALLQGEAVRALLGEQRRGRVDCARGRGRHRQRARALHLLAADGRAAAAHHRPQGGPRDAAPHAVDVRGSGAAGGGCAHARARSRAHAPRDPPRPFARARRYQAMVHELLPGGIRNNRVDLKGAKGVSKDLEEVVLSPSDDAFFRENMYSNYGDVASAIQVRGCARKAGATRTHRTHALQPPHPAPCSRCSTSTRRSTRRRPSRCRASRTCSASSKSTPSSRARGSPSASTSRS